MADLIILVLIFSALALLQLMTINWSGIALPDSDPYSIPPRNY